MLYPATTFRGTELPSEVKPQNSFYLDSDEFLLQSFSIRKLLSKAHVDDVFRRAPVVLSELFQICDRR